MKKTLCIISIFIMFILIYLLQSNFFSWFQIAGVSPNLFVILTIFAGLFMGKIYGISIGILIGLCLDLLIGRTVRNKRYSYGASWFSRRQTKR